MIDNKMVTKVQIITTHAYTQCNIHILHTIHTYTSYIIHTHSKWGLEFPNGKKYENFNKLSEHIYAEISTDKNLVNPNIEYQVILDSGVDDIFSTSNGNHVVFDKQIHSIFKNGKPINKANTAVDPPHGATVYIYMYRNSSFHQWNNWSNEFHLLL